MTIYLATACGVSIEFQEGTDIAWFVDMATQRGGTVHIEKLPEPS